MKAVVLSFSPAVKCWRCNLPAQYGVYDEDELLRPGCPRHGYAWDVDDQAAELASIERFVLFLYGGPGRARVLARLADVKYADGSTDYVWRCEYTNDFASLRVCVLWDNATLNFMRCECDMPNNAL